MVAVALAQTGCRYLIDGYAFGVPRLAQVNTPSTPPIWLHAVGGGDLLYNDRMDTDALILHLCLLIETLYRRIAELERHIADLEPKG